MAVSIDEWVRIHKRVLDGERAAVLEYRGKKHGTPNNAVPDRESCGRLAPKLAGMSQNIERSCLKRRHGAWHSVPPVEGWTLDAGCVARVAEHPKAQAA